MADKRKRWIFYYDETMERNMNRLREETAAKDGVPISDITIKRVVTDTLAEKYIEYVDKKNNRARITVIMEKIDNLEKEVTRLSDEVSRLRLAIKTENNR